MTRALDNKINFSMAEIHFPSNLMLVILLSFFYVEAQAGSYYGQKMRPSPSMSSCYPCHCDKYPREDLCATTSKTFYNPCFLNYYNKKVMAKGGVPLTRVHSGKCFEENHPNYYQQYIHPSYVQGAFSQCDESDEISIGFDGPDIILKCTGSQGNGHRYQYSTSTAKVITTKPSATSTTTTTKEPSTLPPRKQPNQPKKYYYSYTYKDKH